MNCSAILLLVGLVYMNQVLAITVNDFYDVSSAQLQLDDGNDIISPSYISSSTFFLFGEDYNQFYVSRHEALSSKYWLVDKYNHAVEWKQL